MNYSSAYFYRLALLFFALLVASMIPGQSGRLALPLRLAAIPQAPRPVREFTLATTATRSTTRTDRAPARGRSTTRGDDARNVRGRGATSPRPAPGQRRPRDSDETTATPNTPAAQRTRTEDVTAGRQEPRTPCNVCTAVHQYSCVYTPLLAHVYGNVSLEAPPHGLFYRGNGSLRSAMHAAASRARAGLIGKPEFEVNVLLWNTSREGIYGGYYVNAATQLSLYDAFPGASHIELEPLLGTWYHALTPQHQPRRSLSTQERLIQEGGDFAGGRRRSISEGARYTTARRQDNSAHSAQLRSGTRARRPPTRPGATLPAPPPPPGPTRREVREAAAEAARQSAALRADATDQQRGAEDTAELGGVQGLADRVRFQNHQHNATIRPWAVEAHAAQARLEARSLGIILPEECRLSSSSNSPDPWGEFMGVRRRIYRRGGHALAVLNKTLDKPLPEKEAYFSNVGVDASPLEHERRQLDYSFDYAVRRFEVDDMTADAKTCEICTFSAPDRGVFSCTQTGGNFRDVHSARKFVFKVPDALSPCGFSYRFELRTAAMQNWTEQGVVCRHCFSDLEGSSKQPSFSEPAGFHHGVAVPDELKGLSFAEEALIARIQPAMAATTIKGGQRSLRGHVTFFDRTNELMELAELLPRLQSAIPVVELEREVGSIGGRMVVFRVRRIKYPRASRIKHTTGNPSNKQIAKQATIISLCL